MADKQIITCATCQRAVWTTDVDADGRCTLCQPAPSPVADPDRPARAERDAD